MKIAYNPKTASVITTATAANDDILFDLNARKVWAKGLRMGADWADISSKPSSLKNPYALTISLNGTSQGPYDGSAAKNINITPGSIGAATSGHNHDGRYVYNYGGTQMDGASKNKNALGMSSNSGITGDWWHILQAAWNDEYRWNSLIAFPTENRNGMYYRSGLDDNTKWGSWVKLLDTGNSYVRDGKGVINGTTITQVDNATNASVASKVYGHVEDTGSHELVRCDMNNDQFRIIAGSNGNNNGWAEIATADDGNEPIYVRQYTGIFSTIKRTLTLLDAHGYTHFPGYINIGGNENNNSSPDRVWGSNGSDSYLRSYRTSALRVAYAVNANSATTASSANKLTTARNIALGTDLRGSANFDGSSNITIHANINACTVQVFGTNGLPFKRIAHFETERGWNDNALLLYISLGYINGNNGICRVEFRTEDISSSSTSVTASAAVRWLVRNGYSLDSLYAGYYVTTGKAYIDIYLKTTGGYQGTVIRVLLDSRGGINSNVLLINSYYHSDSDHKEAYNSIEAASTTLYNRAYTRIVSGSDVGTVNYANSTGNASSATKLQTPRNLWGNSFDGTRDVNGSIIFPNIEDIAISNKISWSGSTDGADIYYLTTATDLGNLVLNVKDDTNAYIQLALNGVFKSHFDVANSYWTGRSAQADKWTTTRTFKIGNTAKNVDGSGNVSWSLAEIGVRDTWRTVQVNGTSIGNNTLNLCGSTYIGLTNVNGKVTFSLVGSGTTANQAILSNGTANGWTLKTLNIDNWNTAYTFVSTITGTDTDDVINKWDEIVNFLAGITEDNKLNTLLNSKLSVYKLADNTDVGAIKNNGIYYSTADASSGTLVNSPFNNGFTLINMTSLDHGDDLRRSRLAFNAYGEIKVSNDRGLANTAETWYNVLTSKNSGIDGSTIKLNGTSITVYSSSTADGRYVKKSGDTMSGALNFANNTWNIVGDDVAMGDYNVAGCLGIKGLNAGPGLAFYNSSNTLLSKLVGTANLFLRVSGDNVFNILDTSSTYVSNGKGIINGTTITQVDNARKLVNWYSARPTSLNTQFGDGSLRIFYATSSTTEGKPAEDSPILHLAWDNNSGWDTQLAVHTRSGKVSTRAQNSGTWQPWKTLAFTTDIPSSLKNPHSLTLKANGTTLATYDGSSAKEVNFTYANVGAASASHNHDDKYLRLDGSSTMTGQIKSSYSAGTLIAGCTNAILKATSKGYNSLICAPIKSGNICISAWTNEENLNFGYAINGKTDNSFDTRMYWDAPNNNLHATAFTGHLYGTADNATNSDKLDGIHANGLLTALSNSNNGISVTVGGTTKSISNISVNHANSAGSATNVIVNLHTTNDTNYPLVWSNLNNVNNATENQLFKSWLDLYYNPKNKRLFVGGSVSTSNINATGTVTSAGFKHSGVTENADLYVLTAGGGYTFLNLTSNELAHEFDVDITVTSEWLDIEDFYGGNLNFLTLPGTYIVLVYYTTNSANSMYEGYFSGIMSWYTGTTNSNNADEIVLHRVGHAYANTIYLRTRESLKNDPHPYTKLQISANSDLKLHTYKFKFKRIC